MGLASSARRDTLDSCWVNKHSPFPLDLPFQCNVWKPHFDLGMGFQPDCDLPTPSTCLVDPRLAEPGPIVNKSVPLSICLSIIYMILLLFSTPADTMG